MVIFSIVGHKEKRKGRRKISETLLLSGENLEAEPGSKFISWFFMKT